MAPNTTTPVTGAGTTPASVKPQTSAQRMINMVQTLQFGWFMGHLTLLLATLRYTISFIKFNTSTTTAYLVYRIAFISAAATYGIVVYKAYRARIKTTGQNSAGLQNQVWAMLGDENVQYLIMALIWLVSKPVFLALLPFSIYSTFHFLTYLRTALIPTLMPSQPAVTAPGSTTGAAPAVKKPNALSDTISKFVKSHYDTSMAIVANLEIALLVRLFLGCCIFVNSWILLAVYALFLRVRVGQSAFVRQALVSTEVRVDGLLADQRVPPPVRQAWGAIKDGVRRVGAATDVGDLTGGRVGGAGSPVAPRKTQ